MVIFPGLCLGMGIFLRSEIIAGSLQLCEQGPVTEAVLELLIEFGLVFLHGQDVKSFVFVDDLADDVPKRAICIYRDDGIRDLELLQDFGDGRPFTAFFIPAVISGSSVPIKVRMRSLEGMPFSKGSNFLNVSRYAFPKFSIPP